MKTILVLLTVFIFHTPAFGAEAFPIAMPQIDAMPTKASELVGPAMTTRVIAVALFYQLQDLRTHYPGTMHFKAYLDDHGRVTFVPAPFIV